LRNDTGVNFDFCEVPPKTDLQHEQPSTATEADARIGWLPADGTGVPLQWRERTGDGHGRKSELARKLCLRPTNGLHDWCAPFSAEAIGKVVLKLRPRALVLTDSDREAALDQLRERYEGGTIDAPVKGKGGALKSAMKPGATSAHTLLGYEGETLYLVLTVTMKGSQRLLRIKSLTQRQLPFKVVNQSDSLVAFRQHGCDCWDLLGAAESCDYTWDDPLGTRALQLYACDAMGSHAGMSAPGAYTFARSTAGKVTACPDLKLEGRQGHLCAKAAASSTNARSSQSLPTPGSSAVRMVALQTPLLLSAACNLITAYAPRPRTQRDEAAEVVSSNQILRRTLTRESGWLCLTSTHVLFVPFEKPGGDARKAHLSGLRISLPRRSSTRGMAAAAAATTAASCIGIGENMHSIHQLQHAPLKLEEIASLRTGALPGELLLFTHFGSHVVVRSLYQADAVRGRISSQHQKLRGDRYQPSRSAAASSASDPPALAAVEATLSAPSPRPAPSPQRGMGVNLPSREVASRTVQAMVRVAKAKRELKRRRAEQLYESGTSAIAGVLARPNHAPSLLRTTAISRFQSNSLIDAVRMGNLSEAQSLLGSRADPDSLDGHGLGALHVACAHNHPLLLALLLEAGADVELSESRHRLRALHAAAGTSNRAEGFACVSRLIAAGANPMAARGDGRTPAQVAQPGSRARRTLHNSEAVWASRDSPLTPRPALVHAVATGRTARVFELLAIQTDPDSIDEHGTGALHAGCACGDDAAPLVRMLIDAGASVNRAARDSIGSRPLHCAAQAEAAKCVELLIAAHADPTRRDRSQRLPVELCGSGEDFVGGPSAAALRLLTNAMQQAQIAVRPGAAQHGAAGSASRSLTLKVTMLLKGPVSEIRLYNESDDLRKLESIEADEAESQRPVSACDVASAVLLDLQLAGIGLSIIDGEPRELVYVFFQNLRLRASRSKSQQSLELLLARLQVDAAVPSTKFPVMLAPLPPPSSRGGLAEEDVCVEFSVTHNRRWHSLIYLEYVGLAVRPLRLQLEQNTTARLLRLFDSLSRVQLQMDRAATQLQGHTGGSQRPLAASTVADGGSGCRTGDGMIGVGGHAADGWSRSEPSGLLHPGGGGMVGGGMTGGVQRDGNGSGRMRADSVRGALPAAFLKFYIQELELHQVSLTVTVQMDMVCDEVELQRYHPTTSLVGVARHLIALQNVNVTLDRFYMCEVFDTGDALLNRIVRFYAVKATLQLYKLIGSMDLLGNPAAIFADVGGGVRELYSEGRKGHVVKSIGALAAGVVGGTGALTMGATSGLARGVSEAAASLAYDKKYNMRRQLILQKQASSVREGLFLGAQVLGGGLSSGVAGVLRQPIKGLRQSGAKGFVRGVGKGAVGLVMKPASGIAAAVSKAAEGAASDAKHMQKAGNSDSGTVHVLRVRQPRDLKTSVLMPYPRAFRMAF